MLKMSSSSEITTLICDLDGTLLESGTCNLKAEDASALKRWKDSGRQLWIATGRGIYTKDQLHKMNIDPGIMVCSSGAVILYGSQDPVYQGAISADAFHAFETWSLQSFPRLDYFLDIAESNERYAKMDNGIMQQHFKNRDLKVNPLSAFDFNKGKLLRIFCKGPSEAYVAKAAEALNTAFAGILQSYETDICCMDVLAAGVNKWNSLSAAMKVCHTDSCHFAAIGDSESDLDMIRSCRIGFTMKESVAAKMYSKAISVSAVSQAIQYLLGY